MRSTAPRRPGGSGMGFGFTLTPWVKRLLVANGVVFLLTLPLSPRFVVDWLAFTPSRILVAPWGIATYMFVHGGFWHLFINMLMLFFFGPPLEERWGSREFIRYYLLCGLGGAALSFVFLNSAIVGASAAVYGVMLAFAMNWPEMPIYVWGIFPVKAKWLVAFMFAVSFLSAFGGATDGVAHFAHLGGFLTGFIYLKSDWRLASKAEKLKKKLRLQKLAIVPSGDEAREEGEGGGGSGPARGRRDEEELLDAVDEVLDKISESGLSSLSDEERRLLDEVSRRRRSN